MVNKLKRHITRSKDDDEVDVELDDEDIEIDDSPIDPRWEGLQNILDNK
jgi:hypothetical protein